MSNRLSRTVLGGIAGLVLGLAGLYGGLMLTSQSHLSGSAPSLTHLFGEGRTWLVASVILGLSGLLAALVVASAIADHTQALRDVAEQDALQQAAEWVVTDENWQATVEQILADLVGEPVYINSFTAMSGGPVAWIRFMGRDSRAWVFATQPRVPDCRGKGMRIRFDISRRAAGELRAIWSFFQKQSQQAAPLPRNTQWYLLPAQTPQKYTTRRTPFHVGESLRAIPLSGRLALKRPGRGAV